MTVATLSPGPWYRSPGCGYGWEIHDFNGVWISQVHSGHNHLSDVSKPDNVGEANANVMAAAWELLEALEQIEDTLGFHEGSEEVQHPGQRPVIWINAEGDSGDFQVMLHKARAAIAKAMPALVEPPSDTEVA